MPLKVQKQGRESSQSIVRRFTQKLRRSGILVEARKNRFYKRTQSAQLRKRSALRRAKKKQEYTELKKLGKI
ncbi:MAG: 30S ribosomal protein S21 [Parcubacteria group bacterium]|nr:30S ribosomal protein S21 [Parcubacteria group bacterium]